MCRAGLDPKDPTQAKSENPQVAPPLVQPSVRRVIVPRRCTVRCGSNRSQLLVNRLSYGTYGIFTFTI